MTFKENDILIQKHNSPGCIYIIEVAHVFEKEYACYTKYNNYSIIMSGYYEKDIIEQNYRLITKLEKLLYL